MQDLTLFSPTALNSTALLLLPDFLTVSPPPW